MRDDFAVMITTHGRPNCKTFHTFRRQGYTGQMFCVVDSLDKTVTEYEDNFGKDNVWVFDKEDYIDTMERMTNERILSTVLYARKACYSLAREKNINYFIICDDDIELLKIRKIRSEKLKSINIDNLNEVLEPMISYMDDTNISLLGIADAGIYFGGKNGVFANEYRRMFSVCYMVNANNPIEFGSVCFEDLWGTVQNSREGKVLFETLYICHQGEPMGNGTSGGTTDFYRNNSLFKRNWYDVMAFPDCFFINSKGVLGRREINMCPKIISSRYKKCQV